MWSFPITCRFPGFRRARHPRQPGGDHRRQPAQVQQGGDPQGRDAVGGRRRLPRWRHQVALPPGSVRSFFFACLSWSGEGGFSQLCFCMIQDKQHRLLIRWPQCWRIQQAESLPVLEQSIHCYFFFGGGGVVIDSFLTYFWVILRFDRLADSWTPMPDMLYPGGIEVKRDLHGIGIVLFSDNEL